MAATSPDQPDVLATDSPSQQPSPAAFAQARATRPELCGSYAPERPYPIYLRGLVERGFGRGGKDLGCPTANLPSKVFQTATAMQRTGIYYGFARVLAQDPDDPDLVDLADSINEGSSNSSGGVGGAVGGEADEGEDDIAIQMDDDGDDIVLSASPINEEADMELMGGGNGGASQMLLKRRQLSRSSIRSSRSVKGVLEQADRLNLERSISTGSGNASQSGEVSPAAATMPTGLAHTIPTSGPSSSSAEASASVDGGMTAAQAASSSRTGSLPSSQSGSLRKKRKARVALASEDAQVFPMVMSVGWNPFYKNTTKTAEVHIMHDFHADFYGLEMRVVVLGYIRPEYNYVSKEALIQDIEMDKKVAINSLARTPYQDYLSDPFLSAPS